MLGVVGVHTALQLSQTVSNIRNIAQHQGTVASLYSIEPNLASAIEEYTPLRTNEITLTHSDGDAIKIDTSQYDDERVSIAYNAENVDKARSVLESLGVEHPMAMMRLIQRLPSNALVSDIERFEASERRSNTLIGAAWKSVTAQEPRVGAQLMKLLGVTGDDDSVVPALADSVVQLRAVKDLLDYKVFPADQPLAPEYTQVSTTSVGQLLRTARGFVTAAQGHNRLTSNPGIIDTSSELAKMYFPDFVLNAGRDGSIQNGGANVGSGALIERKPGGELVLPSQLANEVALPSADFSSMVRSVAQSLSTEALAERNSQLARTYAMLGEFLANKNLQAASIIAALIVAANTPQLIPYAASSAVSLMPLGSALQVIVALTGNTAVKIAAGEVTRKAVLALWGGSGAQLGLLPRPDGARETMPAAEIRDETRRFIVEVLKTLARGLMRIKPI